MSVVQTCFPPCAPLRPLGIAGLGTSLKLHFAPHKHAPELRSLLIQARRAPTTKAAPPSPCVSRSGSAKIAAASDYADCDAPLTACDEWPSLPTACSAPSGLLGAAPPSGAWARCLLLSVSGLAADDASPSIDGSTPGPLVPAASTGASCCACCGEAADVEPAAAGVAADHAAQDAAGDAAWAPASPASPCSLVVPAAELAPAAGPCDVAALQWCDPGCLAAGLGTSLKLHIVPREHALQLRRLLGQACCMPNGHVNASATVSASADAEMQGIEWPCLPSTSSSHATPRCAAPPTGAWARRLTLAVPTPAADGAAHDAASSRAASAAAPAAASAEPAETAAVCCTRAEGMAPAPAATSTACAASPSALSAQLSAAAEQASAPPAEPFRIPARRQAASAAVLAGSRYPSSSKPYPAAAAAIPAACAAAYKPPQRRSSEEQAAAEEAGRPGRLCPWPLLIAGPQLPAPAWAAAPLYLMAAFHACC